MKDEEDFSLLAIFLGLLLRTAILVGVVIFIAYILQYMF